MMNAFRTVSASILAAALLTAVSGCRTAPPADRVRVSGQVEATEVQVAAQVPGRLVERRVSEGARVDKGATVAVLDTADADLALARARAERGQAEAQLRLVQAGSRIEDVRQAEAQVAAAQADIAPADAELAAAELDVQRFEQLLAANSGSRKQRDDAVARRNVARERVQAARERVRVAQEGVARVKAGARREELDIARARIDAVDAQIATLEKAIADATVVAPVAGVVTTTVAD